MLQVFKIDLPATQTTKGKTGWALACTPEEALTIAAAPEATATADPERLWVSPKKLIWIR